MAGKQPSAFQMPKAHREFYTLQGRHLPSLFPLLSRGPLSPILWPWRDGFHSRFRVCISSQCWDTRLWPVFLQTLSLPLGISGHLPVSLPADSLLVWADSHDSTPLPLCPFQYWVWTICRLTFCWDRVSNIGKRAGERWLYVENRCTRTS